jgi:hypothetical protein
LLIDSAAIDGPMQLSAKSRIEFASASGVNSKTRRTKISQVFDLAPSPSTRTQYIPSKRPDVPWIVVVTMCAIAIVLSMLSLVLPGWVFQPSDVTAFPLP